MCKLKFQSEEVFVLAFGGARYAFRHHRNEVYKLLPAAEAKKYIGHGAPSQKLFFADNQAAHKVFKTAQALQVSADGELIIVQDGTNCRGYLFNPAINKYVPVLEEPTNHCELYCGGGVIVLGFLTYKKILYRGISNQLYVLSGNLSTVEISGDDKIFITDTRDKSTVYYYERGMKQMVVLG